ncbi:MAG: hypothetical protein M0R74_05450 [Dehalococcoidia bacterium]|nr:hypothetical protein [Dehalococcoidia bacterium]
MTTTPSVEPAHHPEPPGTTWGRLWAALAIMAVLGFSSLFVFPPLLLIALYLGGPPLLALFLSGPGRDRNTFSANGVAGAAGGALSGALWVATHPGGAHPLAVVISTFVTFLVMSVAAAVVVWLVSFRVRESP